MFDAAVTEFPFVEALPKRERSKLVKLWDHLKEIKAATAEHGVLLPQHYAADLLGVSRQRVHVLVNEGRLLTVEVGGLRYVTENSMRSYAESERKGGRPGTVSNRRETFRSALDSAKEMVSKIS